MKITIGVLAIILCIPLTIYSAFVCGCMWDWFVVPSFNLPHVSLGHMIGITMLIGFLRGKGLEDRDDTKEYKVIEKLLTTLGYISMVWGFAFIVHLIVG